MSASGPLNPHRLLILQPYVPAYRVPLFAAMKAELAEQGIELAVASARASGADRSRDDDASASAADFHLDEQRLSVGSRSLLVRRVGPIIQSFRPGLVVVEQAIKNAESWPLLVGRRHRSRPSVAMWGQGRSYSTSQSALEGRAKQWLTLHADWFFAYTQSGADFVVEHGFPRARTTVLRNSTDTRELRACIASLRESDVDGYREEHDLRAHRTALFLGGLDARKGIPFLLATAKEVARRMPDFTLLIGGSGEMATEVARAQHVGYPVRHLGRVDGREKALALATADILMIPEWIGLIAVDGLASGNPIVTTRHTAHSPEVEYLQDGQTALFVDHTVDAYASAVVALLGDSAKLEAMRAHCTEAAESLSIERMAHAFVSGVCAWQNQVYR